MYVCGGVSEFVKTYFKKDVSENIYVANKILRMYYKY